VDRPDPRCQAGGPDDRVGEPTTGLAAQAGDSSVVDRLVDMNLDLADASTPAERNEIFAEQSAPLTATLEQDHLAPRKKNWPASCWRTAKWLSSNTDPFDEAERLVNVAGLLFDQLQEAAPAGDAKVLARLTRRYGLVAARLDNARAKLADVKNLNPSRNTAMSAWCAARPRSSSGCRTCCSAPRRCRGKKSAKNWKTSAGWQKEEAARQMKDNGARRRGHLSGNRGRWRGRGEKGRKIHNSADRQCDRPSYRPADSWRALGVVRELALSWEHVVTRLPQAFFTAVRIRSLSSTRT